MPSGEDVQRQQELLTAHRQRLADYLLEQARQGALVDPATVMGIEDLRAQIRRIKTVLRSWNVNVEDFPDDERSTALT